MAVEAGTPGARRARSLRGAFRNAPFFWDASEPTLEGAIDRMLAVEMGGRQLPDHDRAALIAYVRSLSPYDNGRVQPDGAPTEPTTLSARRGAAVFDDAGCDLCHPAPSFFRARVSNVGTGDIDIPSLRGLTSTEGPYGHDGRWRHLDDALDAILRARDVQLSHDEKVQLLAYLNLL